MPEGYLVTDGNATMGNIGVSEYDPALTERAATLYAHYLTKLYDHEHWPVSMGKVEHVTDEVPSWTKRTVE